MVLILEDDDILRDIMVKYLERQGWRCVAARNKHEAIAHIHDRLANLRWLILDRTLPDGNGIEVAHAARRARPDIPVVLISGDHNPPDPDEGLIFLPKPFRLSRLHETMARHGTEEAGDRPRRPDIPS